VWKDRAKFRRECDPLWPIRKGVDPAVLTQVLVPRGRVAAQFRADSGRAVFRPAKDEEADYDRLAPEVTISFEAQEKVEIASYSLDDGDPIDSIYFSGNDGEKIDIVIGNSDLADLRYRIEGRPPTGETGPDRDYELYYRLVKEPDDPSADDEFLPVPYRDGIFDEGLVKNCYGTFVGGGGG
jgi:hypothetical protein